jgi:hypothetical protein
MPVIEIATIAAVSLLHSVVMIYYGRTLGYRLAVSALGVPYYLWILLGSSLMPMVALGGYVLFGYVLPLVVLIVVVLGVVHAERTARHGEALTVVYLRGWPVITGLLVLSALLEYALETLARYL